MQINLNLIVRKIKPMYFFLGAVIVLVAAFDSAIYFSLVEDLPATGTEFSLNPLSQNFEFTQPLPFSVRLDARKIVLGEKLFRDARLSGNNSIKCTSCHDLSTGGMDNRFRSHGVGGENLVNTPSIFNTGFNFVQSWDGRASSLDAHLESHLTDKRVMASSWSQLIGKLVNNAEVSLQFARIYDDGITATNIKDVIATYERSLVTPNSRFDKFLRGDPLALSHEEKQGYELFQSYGCSRCHQGINLGGNMFAKMGLMGDYFKDRGDLAEVDNGRYNVNHEAHSLREFRVPSLRNVALTSPYFHDGYAKSLEQAVSIMAKYQLGRAMPDSDVALIAQFLRTLTGTYLGKPL